jgi:phage shock protein A
VLCILFNNKSGPLKGKRVYAEYRKAKSRDCVKQDIRELAKDLEQDHATFRSTLSSWIEGGIATLETKIAEMEKKEQVLAEQMNQARVAALAGLDLAGPIPGARMIRAETHLIRSLEKAWALFDRIQRKAEKAPRTKKKAKES